MWNALRLFGTFILAAALAACTMSHGPGGVAYSTGAPASVGGTTDSAGGTISGGNSGEVQKGERGNTPPGMDRDGHGPAAGAILDPTGAATRGKPY
jgi:hypothetical protein